MIGTLMQYNAWANARTFEAVAALPASEAAKERVSLFGNMVHTLNHNYVIGLIWKGHLEHRDHGFSARNTKEHPPLAELGSLQAALDGWYQRQAEENLEERIDFVLIGGNAGRMSRGEILLHIVNHNTYHRGFVADMFYQVPAKPPLTDLPVYLRERPQ